MLYLLCNNLNNIIHYYEQFKLEFTIIINIPIN